MRVTSGVAALLLVSCGGAPERPGELPGSVAVGAATLREWRCGTGALRVEAALETDVGAMTVRIHVDGIKEGARVSVELDSDGDGAIDAVVETIMGASPTTETVTRIPMLLPSLVNATATSNVCTLTGLR